MSKVKIKKKILTIKKKKKNEVRNVEVPVYLLFVRYEPSRVSEWVHEY